MGGACRFRRSLPGAAARRTCASGAPAAPSVLLLDGDRDRVLVRTVPAVLAGPDAPELVRDLLADFVDGDPEGTVEAAVDDLLGDMACYPAVTGNESLAEGSVVALLSALDDCENPYACPHGRPVLVELGTEEIEARFERDYPGHGGRRDS